VRPHDIEVVPYDASGAGLAAVLRYVHAAGPQARLTLEQVRSREIVEVEISRSELVHLDLKVGDLACLRLRQAHSFDEDYAI
jgi:sulfate transport system ATP-binding protein